MLENRNDRISSDYGSYTIISPFEDKKILSPAFCAVCGMKGMAYTDPKFPPVSHYCIKHNASIKKEDRKH